MFKVDFEKTYDAVDWGSSMVVMESMRFLNKWRQWMYECSSMALMCVLVEEIFKSSVKEGRVAEMENSWL